VPGPLPESPAADLLKKALSTSSPKRPSYLEIIQGPSTGCRHHHGA